MRAVPRLNRPRLMQRDKGDKGESHPYTAAWTNQSVHAMACVCRCHVPVHLHGASAIGTAAQQPPSHSPVWLMSLRLAWSWLWSCAAFVSAALRHSGGAPALARAELTSDSSDTCQPVVTGLGVWGGRVGG